MRQTLYILVAVLLFTNGYQTVERLKLERQLMLANELLTDSEINNKAHISVLAGLFQDYKSWRSRRP